MASTGEGRRGTGALDEIFAPRSIAVVGASNREGTVGFSLFQNLLTGHYRGVVYPVNPSWKSVSGVRCYAEIGDLPEAPDLGIVIVPAAGVAEVVRALGRIGTRGAIVISSGFREVGPAGAELEARVVAEARRARMALVGPNCFGVINTDPAVGLNATFSESLPPRGNIAFISQSGALCAGILQYGIAERIGFSRFVSMGNRAGLDENDLMGALAEDPATRVILVYVESLADGRRFLTAAREVTRRKPVLVIKSGRSPEGERAARSHTGSLAQSSRDRLFDAVFAQSGVIRAESIGDLFRMARVFGTTPELKGRRLAILTNSGGPGIVAADACARRAIALPLPTPGLAARLRRILPAAAAVANPVDMTADANEARYRRSLELLLRSTEYDAALVIATPTGTLTSEAVVRAIEQGRGRTGKPVVACLFGLTDISASVGALEGAGIPTFTFPEEAIEGIAGLVAYRRWRERPRTRVRRFPVDRRRARRAIARARARGATVLPEYQARELLEAYGIRFPASATASTVEEAVAAADRIGYPIVLKIASPDISHKTDVGGVRLGIEDGDALRAAWAEMRRTIQERAPSARIEGVEVEAQIPEGPEVLIGLQRDPHFGPILAFALGGIYVEAIQDVTFRLAPIVSYSAEQMVRSVRGFPVLEGMRGRPAGDLPALYEAIERISQLAVEQPEIAELDLNPLIVRPRGSGVVAVDARVVLAPPSRSESPA
ncbi:MAG: acetate--CoA ligase family protein [Thermoplasmata archaeon]